MELAPALRSASAMKVSLPTEMSGSVQTINSTRVCGTAASFVCKAASRSEDHSPRFFPASGGTENIRQFSRGGDDFVDGVRIHVVTGDAESVECPDGVQAIEAVRDQDQIRVQRGNLLEIGIDAAANFGLFLRVGRIVAKIGIAHQAILQAEGVNRFRQAGRKRNNARGREAEYELCGRLRRSLPWWWEAQVQPGGIVCAGRVNAMASRESTRGTRCAS